MVKINEVVFDKNGNKGTIERIITKSTGYVLVSYDNGTKKKEMAFNLHDEKGNPLRKAPKAYAPKEMTPLEKSISATKWVNGITPGDRNSLSYKIWLDYICEIEIAAKEQGNTFIASVCQTVDRYMRVSDKQAYCLGKFAFDNNIKF